MVEMNSQGFRIYNEKGNKCYGVAQFIYKGFEVSMSEMGRNKGACATPVAVYKRDELITAFYTVEEAIEFINRA